MKKSKKYGLKGTIFICMITILIFCQGKMVKAEDGYGTYGDKIKWHFYQSTGHLEITGSGQMPEEEAPWNNYQNKIKSIHIPSSIRIIEEKVFSRCEKLTYVIIPATVESTGNPYGNRQKRRKSHLQMLK